MCPMYPTEPGTQQQVLNMHGMQMGEWKDLTEDKFRESIDHEATIRGLF